MACSCASSCIYGGFTAALGTSPAALNGLLLLLLLLVLLLWISRLYLQIPGVANALCFATAASAPGAQIECRQLLILWVLPPTMLLPSDPTHGALHSLTPFPAAYTQTALLV
jgi:hypothetical protein